jgi:hypothetical protein
MLCVELVEIAHTVPQRFDIRKSFELNPFRGALQLFFETLVVNPSRSHQKIKVMQ